MRILALTVRVFLNTVARCPAAVSQSKIAGESPQPLVEHASRLVLVHAEMGIREVAMESALTAVNTANDAYC